MSSPISEREFEQRADEILNALSKALDESGLDAEVELSMGILSIEFPDGTKYVVNSHRAAKQIWMAAEREAWHFDPTPTGSWVAAKSGADFVGTLTKVLSKKAGSPVALSL